MALAAITPHAGAIDIHFFLRERTQLIEHFYDTASMSMRRIEARGDGYNDLPYDESGKPPYLDEWRRAEIELTRRAALSTLPESVAAGIRMLGLSNPHTDSQTQRKSPEQLSSFGADFE